MTTARIREQVLAALVEVAPEVAPDEIDPDRPLREQVDIDSYDFLRLVVALAERLGVEVPERDYDEIPTLNRLIGYLEARAASPRTQ